MPIRKTERAPDPKKGIYGHDMLTSKRIRAEQREIKRCLALLEKHEKLLEELAREHNIDFNSEKVESTPIPLAVPLIPNRRKKKRST
ncbi:MAG: hypothetical protein WCC79_07855 [Nitrososphaeraceae archaeon]